MPKRRLKKVEISLAKTTEVADRRAVDAPEQLRVVPVDVQDPYNPNETIRVVRSTRDPLTWMHSRGAIDEPQRLAGEYWRECWNVAQFGTSRSTDPMKEYVDGGAIYEPITDHQIRASKYLARCRRELGLIGDWVIHRVLADNLFPKDIAKLFGQNGDRALRYWTGRVRESLQCIALVFTVRS